MNYFDLNWEWQKTNLRICLPIMLTFVFFCIYWFTAHSKNIKEKFYSKYDFDTASIKHIFFTKYFGLISMGIIPIILCLIIMPDLSLANYGLTVIPETTLFSLVWFVGMAAVILPLTYLSAKNPKGHVNYPQIRAKLWTSKTLLINALGWLLYLIGYEILFRGILLMPLVEPLGMWTAVVINVALYSATHIPKGLGETLGAIPLGFLLCILTIASGTIWIALFIHIAMAWTNSFSSLKFNCEMQLSSKH